MHRKVGGTLEGKNLTLHVPTMAAEMVGVLDGWFTWLDTSDADSVRGHVQQHRSTVAHLAGVTTSDVVVGYRTFRDGRHGGDRLRVRR